jgi:hypothetical protein
MILPFDGGSISRGVGEFLYKGSLDTRLDLGEATRQQHIFTFTGVFDSSSEVIRMIRRRAAGRVGPIRPMCLAKN